MFIIELKSAYHVYIAQREIKHISLSLICFANGKKCVRVRNVNLHYISSIKSGQRTVDGVKNKKKSLFYTEALSLNSVDNFIPFINLSITFTILGLSLYSTAFNCTGF